MLLIVSFWKVSPHWSNVSDETNDNLSRKLMGEIFASWRVYKIQTPGPEMSYMKDLCPVWFFATIMEFWGKAEILKGR